MTGNEDLGSIREYDAWPQVGGASADDSAETVDLSARPTPPQTRRGHPLFLISGLLIFLGCYLINVAAHGRPDELAPVLALIGVFNVYELLVLTLGVWLLRRVGGGATQGRQLLGIAVLLLADTTMIYNELAIAHLPLGSVAAVAGLALAVAKLEVIGRASQVRLERVGWAAAVGGLALAFGLPVAARWVGATGALPSGFTFLVWWLIAALAGAALWTATERHPAGRSGLRRLFVAVPVVSAFIHVGSMHWVYQSELTAGHVAPLLLTASVVWLLRADRADAWARGCGVVSGWAGLVAAGATSMPEPWLSEFLSPWRVWLLVAAAGYAGVWWRQRTLGLLLVWPAALGLAGLAAWPAEAIRRATAMARLTWDVGESLTPRGPMGWGVIAVGLAFVTLGVGAWWSWRRDRVGVRT